jgi:DNA-binding transcriptional LysR family regulator
VADPRLATASVGSERRYAVVAADHRLASRTTVLLADFAGETVAVDAETGTTTEELWGSVARPAEFWLTHGVDEWLTLIASGRAIGVSSEATAAQHPRRGVAFRLLEDAPPISVWLAWWKGNAPPRLDALIEITRRTYSTESA